MPTNPGDSWVVFRYDRANRINRCRRRLGREEWSELAGWRGSRTREWMKRIREARRWLGPPVGGVSGEW